MRQKTFSMETTPHFTMEVGMEQIAMDMETVTVEEITTDMGTTMVMDTTDLKRRCQKNKRRCH